MIEIIPNWHPVFVHFTIALLAMSAVFYVASFLPGERWRTLFLPVARANLIAGVVLTVATVVAGFYAYNSVQHDDPSHAAMTDHRNWALVTAALWSLIGIWEGARAWRRQGRSLMVAAALVIASALLGITGFKGGELVFRYGLGVQSLPKTDDHQHPGGTSAGRRQDDSDGGYAHESEQKGSQDGDSGGHPHGDEGGGHSHGSS